MNEPVATNSGLAVVLALLAPVFAKWGISSDGLAALAGYAFSIVSLAVAAWRIVAARGKVTPVARPRDNAGNALTP